MSLSRAEQLLEVIAPIYVLECVYLNVRLVAFQHVWAGVQTRVVPPVQGLAQDLVLELALEHVLVDALETVYRVVLRRVQQDVGIIVHMAAPERVKVHALLAV